MLTRRIGTLAAVPLLLSVSVSTALAQAVPGGTLDPLTIPKYVTPLVIPPVLFDDAGGTAPINASVALREITQQVLPTGFPATPLWAYGDPSPGKEATFNNPAFTFEVTQGATTTVTWINDLVDDSGNYLQHIIKDAAGNPIIDQTLHWAAPNQDCQFGEPRTDCAGASAEPYTGPIPMVTHVHGAHVGPISDGFPEAWTLPAAANITCADPVDPADPSQYDCSGTFYDDINGGAPGTGTAVYQYDNSQPTSTLWYHDHSLGITRLNVYAAGAGFWLIRDTEDSESGLLAGTLPGPAPKAGDNPNCSDPLDPTCVRDSIREIPLAIQPKSFNTDGSQYYPADRAFFEGLGTGGTFADNTGLNIPFLPQSISDIAPVWNPEAFFNTMVVNGNTWPVMEVAPALYRFRLLNASDSRFMNLSLFTLKKNGKQGDELPFFQIGAEQGLLPQVVQIETGFATTLVPGQAPPKNPSQKTKGTFKAQALLMGPAERSDVLVDFSGLPNGTIVRMFNTAPDAPFGGFPDVPADPATTGQVMQFVVNSMLNGKSPTDPVSVNGTPNLNAATSPYDLELDANPGGVAKLGASAGTRDLALLEEESHLLCVTVDAKTGVITLVPGSTPPLCAGGGIPFAPMAAVLGVSGSAGLAGSTAQLWDEPISANPVLNDIETWELWNHSADAHPIHLHLVKFEVVNREVIGGAVRPPEPWEAGWKDTVIAYPGEVTRVKALFDKEGLYVWHCHILSHEDNEMMVPFCVGPTSNDGSCGAVDGGWPVLDPPQALK